MSRIWISGCFDLLHEQSVINCKSILPGSIQAIKIHNNSDAVILISPRRKIESQSPVIMGVINLTPDSFYKGSRYAAIQQSLEKAGEMLEDGAEILDLGAMSTRPGSEEISEEAELERLMPSLQAIRKSFPAAFLSVDTYRSGVAREAAKNDADIINDVSGGTFDELMFDTIAELKLPYVLMHTGGKPKTMQENPVYADVIEDVKSFFAKSLEILNLKGSDQVILDPGFGFGKTIEHNYRLLAGLHVFSKLGKPIMAGISRKSMINKILLTSPANALNGTTVLNTIALLNGADLLRVHDVKEAFECRQLVRAYKELGQD
jgi:dihydropteroate synthase